jgi:membrane protein YqaA with SNARE-associated domain
VLKNSENWYYRPWAVILLLICFLPIGLPLLWLSPYYRKTTKITLTVFLVIVCIGIGVLLGMAVSLWIGPRAEQKLSRQKMQQVQEALAQLQEALELYKTDHGDYPVEIKDELTLRKILGPYLINDPLSQVGLKFESYLSEKTEQGAITHYELTFEIDGRRTVLSSPPR